MRDRDELIDFYRSYGASSFSDDEPAYAEVCHNLGEHPELVDLLVEHDPEAQQPNLLFAAVHYLVLAGLDHPLRAVYAGTSNAAVTPLFADAVLSNRELIDELLRTRRTQTNEVGRSAVLALALNDAHRRSGRELAWVDLGASGGLNLHLDQFRVEYDRDGSMLSTGDENAGLTLRCEVRSGHPEIPATHAPVSWRLGIDRAPLDVTDSADARWLRACLWPSQPERHARMAAAIEIAQGTPCEVIAAEAVDGVAHALAAAPVDAAFVLTTTWVWYYLPAATKAAVVDLLRSSGRKIWWYSLEGRGVVSELEQPLNRELIDSLIGRVEFDRSGSVGATVLGLSHPHGAWLDWYDAD